MLAGCTSQAVVFRPFFLQTFFAKARLGQFRGIAIPAGVWQEWLGSDDGHRFCLLLTAATHAIHAEGQHRLVRVGCVIQEVIDRQARFGGITADAAEATRE